VSEDFPALTGFRAGSLVAGYRLEAQVGAGGMAVVFRAHDERLDRMVALKILGPALAADGAFRRRFIAESRAAAAVDDPHIIPVYEAGEAEGVLFIAMRFVKGGDLRMVLEREGALPPGRAAAFISPVASVLDAAHGVGLVHRDVKPANILVDTRPGRPDHVYLSDFGASKGAMSSVSLTAPGQFLGTPAYSAPEQIQGRAVDGRTDQYALACVAYQLLTGTVPFERDQGMAVLLAHLSEPPPSLRWHRSDLPGAADQVLAMGMAKVPEKRYASCRAFADALREALGLEPYHSGDSLPAPGYPRARIAAPQPWFSRPAPAGKAVAPDPNAGATIDSAPVGAVGHAANPPAAEVTATGAARFGPGADDGAEASAPAATDVPAEGLRTDAAPGSLEKALTADRAHAIRSESGSHEGPPARRWRLRIARRSRLPIAAALLVLLVVVFSGGYIAWRWTQQQYYVGADRGEVVIYRGINQKIAGFNLSRPYQGTGIQLAQVPAPDKQMVTTAYASGSLARVHESVSNIRADVAQCKDRYTSMQEWVPKANAYRAYQAAVAQASRQKKEPPASVANPGPQPARLTGCPDSTAFGITPSDLATASPGPS
jgi:serine/threonine-protein kinase